MTKRQPAGGSAFSRHQSLHQSRAARRKLASDIAEEAPGACRAELPGVEQRGGPAPREVSGSPQKRTERCPASQQQRFKLAPVSCNVRGVLRSRRHATRRIDRERSKLVPARFGAFEEMFGNCHVLPRLVTIA